MKILLATLEENQASPTGAKDRAGVYLSRSARYRNEEKYYAE
jgi:hypothetical protein